MQDKKSENLIVALPKELKDKLRKKANKNYKTLSEVTRDLITRYVRTR